MSGPTQTLLLQSQKMLASTVQFSTYDQTPTRLHRLTRTSPQGQRRYDRRSAPTQEQRPHPVPRAVRSLRTQQRAYDPVLRAIRVPHATEVTPYWGPTEAGGRTGQCSTLEHHPRCARPVEIDGPS
jgi:hypothetical protein